MDDATLTRLVLAHLGRIPGWAWREDGPDYTNDEVALFYGEIGTSPDRAVGARVYGGTDAHLEHLRWRRLQLRIRGAGRQENGSLRPDGADELAGLALLVLPSLSLTAGSGISGVSRQSFSPLGQDANGRQERTENYTIILDNQEARP